MAGSETGVVTNAGIGIQNMHIGYGADVAHSVYKPIPVSGAVYHHHAPAVVGEVDAGSSSMVPVKKKRGRPRKYAAEGSMGLALAPPPLAIAAPPPPPPPVAVGGGFSGGGSGIQFPPAQGHVVEHVVEHAALPAPPSSSSVKKARGRPPGSGKKIHHQQNNLGSTGIGFTPHIIAVKAGEDVASRIMSFSQHGPRAVCILSANGAISNVTLRQAETSGGTVTYEGRFELLSLSGSFMVSESAGHRSRIGGLSVSLAGPDGYVLGGGVAGLLTAASPVQVVVGSFMTEDKKEQRLGHHQMEPFQAPPRLVSGIGLTGQSSPPSRGTPSGSSGGPGSPMNLSMGAACNNNQPRMSGIPWK